jgi:prolyl-tRNA editing enzyme YbaK/EbsC (Cys-tRNA(Pro) deacylase)
VAGGDGGAGRLPRAARRVQDALRVAGLDRDVVVLSESARTAAEAAAAVGVQQGAIVKSLVFRDAAGAPLLVLVSGDNRCDERLLGVTRADAEFVRAQTGYAIGGVPPLGHPAPLHTIVDEQLGRFETVWAAAGTPHAVFPMSFEELVRVTGGDVRSVNEGSG